MEKQYPNGLILKTVAAESDVYLDMALDMVRVIRENNAKDKDTVLIVPVGPTGQYPVFAQIVNEIGLSLKRVHILNMDEYLITPTEAIAPDHPMSFHHRMQTELYNRLDPSLTIPPEQRHFPEPGKEKEYDALLEKLGGADVCYGGIGINGHIAFNEPPEPDVEMTPEEFGALPTRVLPITRETRTVNAIGYQRGDLRGMPEWCITIGMKSLLSAKRVYIALMREWQHGIMRHVLNDPPTARIPASLLQGKKDVVFVSTESIAKGL